MECMRVRTFFLNPKKIPDRPQYPPESSTTQNRPTNVPGSFDQRDVVLLLIRW